MNVSSTHQLLHIVKNIFLGIVVVNLVYLNMVILQNANNGAAVSHEDVSANNKVGCDKDCINQIYGKIYEATASLKPSQSQVAINSTTAPKEYYVSFGSGVGASGEWQDVSGLEAYIDSSKYPNIKKVTFEASMETPTGNQKAYVRLFNKTDQHPVWYSELSIEGGGVRLLISPEIHLDQGNKLYGVQMKTSLKYTTNLLQSRLHIILE